MNRKQSLVRRKYVSQFYKKNHAAFYIALLSSLLIAALNLWIAWVVQQMIDSVSGVPGSFSIPILAGFVISTVGAAIVLKAVSYFSKPRFMEKAMRQYKDYAFSNLTKKSISAFNTENTAQYISAFSNDSASIETGYLEMEFNILANGIKLVGALLMMLAYSPVMTVVACGFFVLPIGVSYLTGNSLEKTERKISEANSQLTATLKDSLSGFSVIKSFKAEVDRAIRLAGLSRLIADRGEEYLCGENGSGLSGGEKQRISIARSLLKNSRVLLVDEATAALDAETACQVSTAILGLADLTSITVTHSLEESLLRQYDCILALKNGTIVETGTFDTLIAKKGYFYSLFTVAQ